MQIRDRRCKVKNKSYKGKNLGISWFLCNATLFFVMFFTNFCLKNILCCIVQKNYAIYMYYCLLKFILLRINRFCAKNKVEYKNNRIFIWTITSIDKQRNLQNLSLYRHNWKCILYLCNIIKINLTIAIHCLCAIYNYVVILGERKNLFVKN